MYWTDQEVGCPEKHSAAMAVSRARKTHGYCRTSCLNFEGILTFEHRKTRRIEVMKRVEVAMSRCMVYWLAQGPR